METPVTTDISPPSYKQEYLVQSDNALGRSSVSKKGFHLARRTALAAIALLNVAYKAYAGN